MSTMHTVKIATPSVVMIAEAAIALLQRGRTYCAENSNFLYPLYAVTVDGRKATNFDLLRDAVDFYLKRVAAADQHVTLQVRLFDNIDYAGTALWEECVIESTVTPDTKEVIVTETYFVNIGLMIGLAFDRSQPLPTDNPDAFKRILAENAISFITSAINGDPALLAEWIDNYKLVDSREE